MKNQPRKGDKKVRRVKVKENYKVDVRNLKNNQAKEREAEYT